MKRDEIDTEYCFRRDKLARKSDIDLNSDDAVTYVPRAPDFSVAVSARAGARW
ncbi:hypothetical protein BC629DRAFT_1521811 [Irpex lacteus]|nr:hypothetical protein BC629DRAFT_1521811 [Irpex lacteus]